MKCCHSLILGLILTVLVSCKKGEEPSSELLELREEVKELKEQQEKSAIKRASENAELEGIFDPFEQEIDQLKERLVESDIKLEDSKKQKLELEQSLKDLQLELKGLKGKLVQQARAAGVGSKFNKISSGRQTYRDVEILEFKENAVRIRHDSGFATLTQGKIPQDWIRKYHFDPPAEKWKRKRKKSVEIAKTSKDLREQPKSEPKSKEVSVSKAQDAVVIITGDQGAGTGFFVKTSSGIYLYTAAHVLSGNSLKSLKFVTRSGRTYRRFGKLQIAHGVDVARLQVVESVPFALRLPERNSVANGVPCVGLGNPGGGSVITADSGAVQAVGPKSFELDAALVKGNSGGPIVLKGTEVAIGLVTHALIGKKGEISSGTRYSKVRRFGARLDVPLRWHRSSLASFLAEPAKLKKIARVTQLLSALSELRAGPNGLRLNVRVSGGDGKTALNILKENIDMRVVQKILKMNTSLAKKNIKPDQRSLNRHFRSLMGQALSAAKSMIVSIRNSGTSPYHMEGAKSLFERNEKAVKGLERAMNRIGR